VNGALSEFVEIMAGDTRWHVAPGVRDQILGPDGLRLEEWISAGQARVVKHGPHRSVYAVSLPDLMIHVKHNRIANMRARLRELARPSKARGECRRAWRVAARNVPTVSPLAVGEYIEGPSKGESYLITRSLTGSTPLDALVLGVLPLLDPLDRTLLQQRLAVALGQFLADLHEGGVLHNDLHAGNILVTPSASNEPRLHLVDLHGVRLGKPLDWETSRANLVVFNRWFTLHAGRTDRMRFWFAYHRARQESCNWPTPRGVEPRKVSMFLARELEERTRQSSADFWRRRERRCRLNTRYFKRVADTGIVGHAVADLDSAFLAALLADPDEPFRRPGIKFLKNSRSSKVVEFDVPVAGQVQRVVYKRFEVKSRHGPWLSLLRRPPALRSWVNGHALRERCLNTARPLAVLHRRRAGLLHEGYLLTLKINDAVELPRFLDDLASVACEDRRAIVRDCIEQVARFVHRMHWRGVSQRDLKGSNLLASDTGRTDALEICVIDLVGVSLGRRLRRYRCVQNLARLNASVGNHPALTRTDLLRFLRIYLRWGISGRLGWKTWWRAIEEATQAKQERNARNRRPLY
jgi:tRNA A-37 threonylcarbamoyl transferase component Bud32